ncbi:hypothetical protein RBWH47_03780 [Rhodopirellula baltica WH47]|uniref:Uncharacterized protein n=1 Tax=Rhodopirellula baltica WH47 TaxID=991778 RepID=F2ANK2_RHOBT|nr:hypothetical protein RBWH47_03780 [Rhodopirellula baltica WH47]
MPVGAGTHWALLSRGDREALVRVFSDEVSQRSGTIGRNLNRMC